MMRIPIIMAIVAALYTIDVSAQVAITTQNNGYRDGDVLYRIVSDCPSIGNSGENCVWILPEISNSNSYVRQMVFLRNDSLTIMEGDQMLHYIVSDDGVFLRGYQNRSLCSVYDRPAAELKYPFAYGDSIADTYSRNSTSFDAFSTVGVGTCYTVCDGWGVLTDGQDSLDNVVRIHHHNSTVSEYDSEDRTDCGEPTKLEITEDKYLWYYPGCRYPVMDTRVINYKLNGTIVSDTAYTSLYMPELQVQELAYDGENSRLLAYREERRSPFDNGRNRLSEEFPIRMSATLQEGESRILLDYNVAEETDAAFYAYDVAGRLLGSVSHTTLENGGHSEMMHLKRRPINGIVMLTMVVRDMQKAVKVR